MKRSNVAGKIPTTGSVLLGEMALNTADVILYASGTTENTILPIGWDRIARSGDTVTGNFIINGDLTVTGNTNTTILSATTISGGTLYGDGSNLTGLGADIYLSGGTVTTGGALELTRSDAVIVSVDLTETKRYIITADEANAISAGNAYLGGSGASFLSFRGNNTSDDEASFNFLVPSDYISGGTFYLKVTSTATANNIQFEMNITSINNGGDTSTPTDTAIQNVTTGAGTSWDMVETVAYVPVSATFSGDKNVIVKINRDASDALDTYTGTAYVWGLVFEYTGIK